MKTQLNYLKACLILMCLIQFACTTAFAKPKILVFTKTKGFHHSAIETGVPVLIKMGQENNFDVDTTTNADKFTADKFRSICSSGVFLVPQEMF